MELFEPALTVINSTVGVGTTREIADRSGLAVVNSPIRGKHARMLEDLSKYKKFVGAIEPEHGRRAAEHFESVGLKTKVLTSPEGDRIGQAHRNHLLRSDDCLGAGFGEVLRPIRCVVRGDHLVL